MHRHPRGRDAERERERHPAVKGGHAAKVPGAAVAVGAALAAAQVAVKAGPGALVPAGAEKAESVVARAAMVRVAVKAEADGASIPASRLRRPDESRILNRE